MAAIILDKISLSSHDVTLSDINLTIKQGGLFALLGLPNSGKSLLLKALMNIVNHDAGQITILGSRQEDQHHLMHFIPRTLPIPATMSAQELLRYYGLREGKINANLLDRTIDNVLSAFGLREVRDTRYHHLSVEHQWCLQIAILVFLNSKIFLWDEPFYNLTPLQRRFLFAHLTQLLPDATIVFTTTSLADALAADECALLHGGQLLWAGHFDELIAHEMTATYDLQVTGNTEHILPIIESLSWVETIEHMRRGIHHHWRITVRNESNAERDLLRAVLADNDLKISHFQLVRPRLKAVLDQIRNLEDSS